MTRNESLGACWMSEHKTREGENIARRDPTRNYVGVMHSVALFLSKEQWQQDEEAKNEKRLCVN